MTNATTYKITITDFDNNTTEYTITANSMLSAEWLALELYRHSGKEVHKIFTKEI